MKAVVSGAAGFLGKRLVKRLAACGHEVTGVDVRPMPPDMREQKGVRWIERDVALNGLLADALEGIDVVFHLAGATLGAKRDEFGFFAANETTTVALLQASAGRVERFVLASSQVVYGNANSIAVTEEFPLDGTASAYGCSKVNSEGWVKLFQRIHGGTSVALRLTGFIEGGGIVDYIISRALLDEPIELYSRGAVSRDYLPADGAIDAFVSAGTIQTDPGFHSYNIGSGQALTTAQLAQEICKELGSRSEIVLCDSPAPSANFVFDISKARRDLGFAPAELAQAIRIYARQKRKSQRATEANAKD